MSKIDRDEAPEGYRAYKFGGKKHYYCVDCEYPDNSRYCSNANCFSSDRKDGVSVIFKKKKDKDVSK